jgi:hypothetical protein
MKALWSRASFAVSRTIRNVEKLIGTDTDGERAIRRLIALMVLRWRSRLVPALSFTIFHSRGIAGEMFRLTLSLLAPHSSCMRSHRSRRERVFSRRGAKEKVVWAISSGAIQKRRSANRTGSTPKRNSKGWQNLLWRYDPSLAIAFAAFDGPLTEVSLGTIGWVPLQDSRYLTTTGAAATGIQTRFRESMTAAVPDACKGAIKRADHRRRFFVLSPLCFCGTRLPCR